jgi:hypothetical protein
VIIRYTFIRYEDPDGTPSVGSGYFVNGRAVLTADHVASGAMHRVVFAGQELPIERTLRSGTGEVELAVLILKDNIAPFEQVRYAELYRGGGATITDVWAVGYPRMNKDDRGRASLEVKGDIVPALGTHPAVIGGPDGEWLTLVGTAAFLEPQIPEDLTDTEERKPWGGMSGAVAIKDGMVVGVIRSPIAAMGPHALAVTPITALRWLPEGTRQQFCEALGLKDIDALPVLGGDDVPVQALVPATSVASAEPVAGPSQPTFSSEVQDRYRLALVEADLPVPDLWNEVELSKLRHAHQAARQARDETADLLESLCLAVRALPVLERVGGRTIAVKKARHVYRRHVGRWPDSGTLEGMLILAASASIAERHRAESDSPNALARFMLGVAGQRAASAFAEDPSGLGTATIASPELRYLVDWLTGPVVRQQEEDVVEYLRTKVGGQSWALIELAAEDSSQRTRPSGVIVDIIPERGPVVTHRVPVTARPDAPQPEEGVCDALREAVSMLPENGVIIDLCLPRRWLDAGVEHWDVVQVGDRYESMSRHFHPRLRWAMHRHDHYLRSRLEKMIKAVDWSAAPEQIPSSVIGDPVSLKAWLADRDKAGIRHPPYITAVSPAREGDDPMGTLLWEGYGLAVWFSAAAKEDVCERAASVAADMKAPERRHDLPEILAVELGEHRPAIIWSDPEGRAGFPLPDSRGGGTLRGGGT